jgi:hypothetical protein
MGSTDDRVGQDRLTREHGRDSKVRAIRPGSRNGPAAGSIGGPSSTSPPSPRDRRSIEQDLAGRWDRNS